MACAVVLEGEEEEGEMVMDWVVRACWDVMAWRLRFDHTLELFEC